MKLDPKAINNALTLAKKVATKIDPGFGGVKPAVPGIGAPLLRKSGGRAGFAAGGSPDPSMAPDLGDGATDSDASIPSNQYAPISSPGYRLQNSESDTPSEFAQDVRGATSGQNVGGVHFDERPVMYQYNKGHVMGPNVSASTQSGPLNLHASHLMGGGSDYGVSAPVAGGTLSVGANTRHGFVPRGVNASYNMRFADGGTVPDFADSLYSHGQRVAETLPPTAQPEQMRSMLQQNGVKGSEMKWSGVSDDLSHPGELSSPDVARAFSMNMAYPEEKVLRNVSRREHQAMTGRHQMEQDHLFANAPEDANEGGEALRKLRRRHQMERRNLENVESPHHEYYTLPGGKNYREILLRHPTSASGEADYSNRDHFGGEPNIIASLRMKDRIDEGTGAPIAHLEELQSDWGQGARHGYQGHPEKTAARDALKAFEEELKSNHASVTDKPFEPLFSALMQDKGQEHDSLRHAAAREKQAMESRPKEPAPFIDKTEDWAGLGLKRALFEAAHGGHDKLAWTPGEDQYARFSDPREPEKTRAQRLAGMKSFYDQMLPKRLLQIARQHDPEAHLTTAAVNIPHGEEDGLPPEMKSLPALRITDRMRESIKKNGFPMYQRGGAVDGYAGGGSAESHSPPSAYFEVAPGKTWDPGQQEAWERLHPNDKADISNKMISEFLKKWQNQTGIEGDVKPGLGGYGGFSNPNFTFHPKDPKHIDAVLKGLGTLFRQDAMMGAHEKPFENSFPSGVVRVHMPQNVHPDEAHAAYKHLNSLGLAEGHSTDLGNGTMDILTDEAGRQATARKIDTALGGRYGVSSYPTHVSFPEHGEHYGVSGGLPGGAPASPTPQAHDHLQAEAASRLQQLLASASQRQPAQVSQPEHFKKGGEVDPSYAEDPGLFDLSSLHETPKVKQFDLPRNVPARGVPPRVSDLMSNKDVFDKAMEVIHKGRQLGGERWYNADPLRLAFMKENGPEKGDQMFRKYMDFVAATSPRSEVGANVRNASYYFARHAAGHGLPEVGEKNPQPYGHLAQRLHQMNAHRVAGEGWDPLNNPKPASFAQNLMGNQAPATVDTHAFRLPAILSRDPRFLETSFQSSPDKPKQSIQKMVESGELSPEDAAKRAAYWQAMPKENEYGAMEQYYKRLAQESGITPAQAQAAAWVGGGHITGLASDESKPFMGFMQDRIMKTAGDTNMEPKDVLQKFVRGEMPLRASGGPVNRALSIAKKAKKK